MKTLIICPNELFSEPRLRKTAIFLDSIGHEVHVLTARTIQKEKNLYVEIKKLYPSIRFHIIDVSKTSFRSRIIWFLSSLLHIINLKVWTFFKLQLLPNKGILNKTLLLSKFPKIKFDLIITSLIDTLPHAIAAKNSLNPDAKVIFDSQEFFTGQYKLFQSEKRDWVEAIEQKHFNNFDAIFATTNVMLAALQKKYKLTNPIYRVRNVPIKKEIPYNQGHEYNETLKLVWHGKSINIGNIRGVHIIIEAVLKARCKCDLYLQGEIDQSNILLLERLKKEFMSENSIYLLPSADPTLIVKSISHYDIGIIGELPKELNQEYTSSNKLFDFIGAGLAIITSSTAGIVETINEYHNGLIYTPGDADELAACIVKLHKNRELLNNLKMNSIKAREKDCFWENELANIIELSSHN
ncbi:hypothetical protein GCM10022246_07830 [Pedobacter ginsengiterrae]|uniref:Uncharacterized protein n=1 Tax=Pedobacter ginsengiterrae TaxID=871696 RepID=A0ABP7NYK0_9SPHI